MPCATSTLPAATWSRRPSAADRPVRRHWDVITWLAATLSQRGDEGDWLITDKAPVDVDIGSWRCGGIRWRALGELIELLINSMLLDPQ
jgi:hypothetical protein